MIVTGDELLPPGTPARGFQIADANSVMLAALIARDGGIARVIGPLPDDRDRIRREIADASAIGRRRPDLGRELGGPRGPRPRPRRRAGRAGGPRRGAPTGGAGGDRLPRRARVPVVLLPGNPVSCLCAYDFFAGPIVRLLGGRPRDWPYRSASSPAGTQARLGRRPRRLRPGPDRARSGRAAGDQRRVDPVEHDPRRRVRRRPGRPGGLPRRGRGRPSGSTTSRRRSSP